MPDRLTFNSWDAVDAALRELGKLDAQIAREIARAQQKKATIEEALQVAISPLNEAHETIYGAIEGFVRDHLDELENRSRKLTSGQVGFRDTPPRVEPVEGRTWDQIVDACQQLNRDDLVAIPPPGPDKKALKRLCTEQAGLAHAIGVELKQDEVFFVKPHPAAANAA